MRVRCNMVVDGGGWLVFQYRHNGEVDFQRNWIDYKQGFGSLESEFWLGNDLLNYFTNRYDHEVYTQGERFNGEVNFAKYAEFKVENEYEKYRLHVSGLNGAKYLDNDIKFSTKDEDNDERSTTQCSHGGTGRGGFWFKACGQFFPNAKYYPTEIAPLHSGLQWRSWVTDVSLKSTEMMIRRKI